MGAQEGPDALSQDCNASLPMLAKISSLVETLGATMARKTAIDKSYLRGAIWLTALAGVIALPAPSQAAELSAEDSVKNNSIVVGAANPVAPTEWLGATPHFVMVGSFKDYSFAIDVRDLAAAKDFEVSAKREYGVKDGGGLNYIDFEVAANMVTDGIERGFEFEFENADFSQHPPVASFALQGEEFPEGLFSNMELQLEWEWVEKSIIVNEEQLYTEGTLTVAHESGTAEADGTMPNGMIGGFVTGTFEGKPIAISFTAPVTEAEIDD